MPAALANLTAVFTAARQQGTADQEAEDLLDQADDLANALQENPKDQDKNDSKDEDEGRGRDRDSGKGEDVAKKVVELERKVEELVGRAGSAPARRYRRSTAPNAGSASSCRTSQALPSG